jgi:hypothetical protein
MSKLKFKYPEMSIKLPQTGLELTVRCLLTREVDALKHSTLSPIQSVISLNEIIYEAIQNKPDNLKTYEDYINNITMQDRNSLLYALYNITFGNDKVFKVMCGRCEKEQQIKVNLNNCYSFLPYPYSTNLIKSYDLVKTVENEVDTEIESVKKEIEEKKETVEENSFNIISRVEKIKLEYAEDAVAYVKQPSIKNELDALNKMVFAENEHVLELTKSLFIQKFEGKNENGEVIIIESPEEILETYNELHITDRKKLNEEYYEKFGKYNSEVKTSWNCKFCNHKNELEIDVASQFFRMVQST